MKYYELKTETTTPNFVFIVLRHVNSEKTNTYWKKSCKHIRIHYPDIKIIIIDDNSNKEYLSTDHDFTNVEIINSEFPKRGELLPYYYFYKYKFAENAVFIHDSVFINEKIDFTNVNQKIKFIWHHNHCNNNIKNETEVINCLEKKDELLRIHRQRNKWYMCFGVMSYINYDFLSLLQDKYKFFNLLELIVSRQKRFGLERVFGLLCCIEEPILLKKPSFLGIGDFCEGEYYPFTKVFTGR